MLLQQEWPLIYFELYWPRIPDKFFINDSFLHTLAKVLKFVVSVKYFIGSVPIFFLFAFLNHSPFLSRYTQQQKNTMGKRGKLVS